MIRLYTILGCPFGHRGAIALREKAVEHEIVFFDVARRPPELEAIGPRAKSPTLFDGDARVHDSLVVLDYIDERYPERPLLPASAVDRAAVRMLVTAFGDDFMPKLAGFRSPEKRAAAEMALAAELPTWDRRFEGRTFAVGDALTLADISVYTPLAALRRMGGASLLEPHAHLGAWLARMDARPTTALPERPEVGKPEAPRTSG